MERGKKSINNQDFYNEGYFDALTDIEVFVGIPLGDERMLVQDILDRIEELRGIQENA